MNALKRLSLLVTMVLGLTALVGAASASASELKAGSYPLVVTGEAGFSDELHQLTTNYYGARSCNAADFAGSLSGASSTLSGDLSDGSCFVDGSWKTLAVGSCNIDFSFNAARPDGSVGGTAAIGPAGCGPIVLRGNCTVSIPAQDGLRVSSFGNVGSAVEITADIAGLEYSQSGSCGGKSGTYRDGKYSGIWDLTGWGGARVWVEGQTPNGFIADQYPATISGTQDSQNPHTFLFGKGESMKCTSATFAGTLTGASTSLSLTPSYSGCTYFAPGLEVRATVNMNGCVYTLYSNSNAVDIDCPQGQMVKITFAVCTVEVVPQDGLTAMMGSLAQVGGIYSMSADWSGVAGFAYNKIDGFLCPFPSGTTRYTDGAFRGRHTIAATNEHGQSISVWAN
jgi:hypothetical protein